MAGKCCWLLLCMLNHLALGYATALPQLRISKRKIRKLIFNAF